MVNPWNKNNHLKKRVKINRLKLTQKPIVFHPQIFFKFMPKDRTNRGLTYKIGRNVDLIPFDYTSDCGPGGIYHFDLPYITAWMRGYGDNIAAIKIPINEPIVRLPYKNKSHIVYITEIMPFSEFCKNRELYFKEKMKCPYYVRLNVFGIFD